MQVQIIISQMHILSDGDTWAVRYSQIECTTVRSSPRSAYLQLTIRQSASVRQHLKPLILKWVLYAGVERTLLVRGRVSAGTHSFDDTFACQHNITRAVVWN